MAPGQTLKWVESGKKSNEQNMEVGEPSRIS